MHTQANHFGIDAGCFPILLNNIPIDGARLQMFIQSARAVVFHGTEERRIKAFMTHRATVFPRFQIFANEPQYHRVNRNKTDLVAFAFDTEVHDALAALNVAQPQKAKLFAADAVIEQGGDNGTVPYTLQRVRGRGRQQRPGLRIAKGRRASFIYWLSAA